jgi:hypothetical protein
LITRLHSTITIATTFTTVTTITTIASTSTSTSTSPYEKKEMNPTPEEKQGTSNNNSSSVTTIPTTAATTTTSTTTGERSSINNDVKEDAIFIVENDGATTTTTTTTSTTTTTTSDSTMLSTTKEKVNKNTAVVLQTNHESSFNDDNDEDDEFVDFITSLRQDGVETGLIVTWPRPKQEPTEQRQGQHVYHLSTKLPEETIAPLFDGTQWAGTRVWKAAIVALEYLLKKENTTTINHRNNNYNNNTSFPSSTSSQLSLLELGCGLGVPGMLWYQTQYDTWMMLKQQQQQLPEQRSELSSQTESLQTQTLKQSPPLPLLLPPRVVLTDHPSLLSQLQSNLTTNFGTNYDDTGDDYHLTTKKHHNIEAKPLSWSKEAILDLLQQEEEQQKQHQHHHSPNHPSTSTSSSSSSEPASFYFDICLNCDCIYEPLYGVEARMALCDVLQTIAIHSPNTLLVTSVERRKGDGVDSFLSDLANSGVVETEQYKDDTSSTGRRIPCVYRTDDDPHHIIEIYVTKGIVKCQ